MAPKTKKAGSAASKATVKKTAGKAAPKKAAAKAKPAKKSGKKKSKKKKLPPPKIVILDDYCKGCGICVALCPTQTLGFEAGKAKVVDIKTCIRCMFCELRCPDFAISVED